MSNKGVKQSTIDKYLGKVFKTNNWGDVVVIEVLECGYCLVKFLKTGNLMEVANKCLLNGKIKDNGTTCRKTTAQTNTKEYRTWKAMLARCYNENTQNKCPTYKGCTVSENFKVYSYFYGWCEKQVGFEEDGWCLDKDILVKENRVYSEDTCCFVPTEINCLIISGESYRGFLPRGVVLDKGSKKPSYRARVSQKGKYVCYGSYSNPEEAFCAYKEAKESYIKFVANEYKDRIDLRVYEALMNWTVEITD